MEEDIKAPDEKEEEAAVIPVRISQVSRIVLTALVIWYTAWFTYHSVDRWSAMHTSLDFVHLDSAAYNTACGKFMFSNAKMINFWAEHISPVLLVVSFFYLFSKAYWFIFFYQSASIALAAVPLFMVAREYLRDERAAALFSAGYLLNGAIQMGNLFDYHEYSHTGFFVFLGVWAAMKGRWALFYACLAGLAAVKEDGFVMMASLGLYAAVACKAYRHAAYTWAACAVVALVEFKVIYPWLRGGEAYKYDTYYSWLGATAMEKAGAILGRPGWVIGELLSSPARVSAWWNLALGMAFLPFASLLGVLMLFFPSMELFLSWYPGAHGLSYHYPLLIMPVWTVAAIMGLSNIIRLVHDRTKREDVRKLLIFAPAVFIIVVNVWQAASYGGLPVVSNPSRFITEQHRVHAAIVREELAKLPAEATMSAHDGPFSFLTHNPNAYLYHGEKTGHAIVDVYRGAPNHGYKMWPFTEIDIEYIILDANAPYEVRQVHKTDVLDVKNHPDYSLLTERDGLYIFKLKEEARRAGKKGP